MVDKAITVFFDERKAAWLKKNLKSSMTDDVKEQLINECNAHYSLKNWIIFAARNAEKRSLSSHPSKFSHSGTGATATNLKNRTYVSPVIYQGHSDCDGFLKTGNVKVDHFDSIGNGSEVGAIGEIGAFLSLILTDGKRFFEHLEIDSNDAKNFLNISEGTYSDSKGALLQIIKQLPPQTNSKIKQVFFPISIDSSNNHSEVDTYHQLSILTASGIVFELRKRLDGMRFGDEIKIARDKKKNNQEHDGYREIYNLTTIGYGGTKPQNISVLNNQNGGKAHLFMSAPPQLNNRLIHFPHSDFFSQTVGYFQCKNQFYHLHKLYSRDDNNMHIRAERDEYYQSVIDHIIEKMWQVRSVSSEQFNPTSNQLSSAQKIWLCEGEVDTTLRETSDDWLDEIVKSITTFLFYGYEKILAKKAIKFSDAELNHMHKLVSLNKEALR
jgi:CRISPR-associated protein Csy1